MKLIGAGLPRTGTLSTQQALIRLGYPCYHMAAVAMYEEHTRAWHAFLVRGEPMPWKQLFEGYLATVDAPAALFYREIFETFPDAKVLLNVREPERWYASLMTLHGVMQELVPYRASNPRLDMWLSVVEAIDQRTVGGALDAETCIRAFHEHNRRVQEEIPKDRLLVWRVQEGWEPLCEFLGCEVPDEPFPHLNEGGDTVRAGLRASFGISETG
jgi:hypothetical protein